MTKHKEYTPEDVPEDLFTPEEIAIDFATAVNMFSGMDYASAYKEAVKDCREYKEIKKQRELLKK